MLLYAIAAIAILAGLWGRFKGLGVWPLNADEYYIARSVENVLRTGFPEYQCGGFYVRGLTFQYVVALLQMAGMSAELSARMIAAVASVIALPAVYILGIRAGGRSVALLAVSAMALSVWEVDVARFGRMYAPFQAVFVWYLVYFLRFTVDRDVRARWSMFVLSLLGLFTWEGGLLLMAVNLLPPFLWKQKGRFVASEIRYLLVAGGLLVAAFLATRSVDFRTSGTSPFPAGYVPASTHAAGVKLGLLGHMSVGPRELIAFVAVAVLTVLSLRWIWTLRDRWPAALGLLVVTGCTLAHQFGAVFFVLAILLLAGMLHWSELFTKASAPFAALIVSSAAAWTIVALGSPHGLTSLGTPWGSHSRFALLVYEFLKFPDFLGVVALPWARHAPVLGAVLLGLLGCATLRILALRDQTLGYERVILLLIVCLLAAASMSDPPRYETRYVFFLYPAALLVAVLTTARVVGRVPVSASVASLATALVLGVGLAAAGDLQPRRLLEIDTAMNNLGAVTAIGGYSNVMDRSDPRGAARWLATHASSPGTLLINGYPGVDYYYRSFDFAYIDRQNQRYEAYACNRGTVERWGNLPLLSSIEELHSTIAQHGRVVMVIDTPTLAKLSGRFGVFQSQMAWMSADGYIAIIEFTAGPAKE
jgi:hypothetical protein